MRTSGRTALLPKPNLYRTGPGGRKPYKKEEPKGSLSLSLSLSPSLPPSLSPAQWGALLFASLDQRALMPRRWIFLLLSK